MAQPKQTVRPTRIHVPSAELETTILRGVGYRARCSCGWTGKNRSRHYMARMDSRDHQASEHATS